MADAEQEAKPVLCHCMISRSHFDDSLLRLGRAISSICVCSAYFVLCLRVTSKCLIFIGYLFPWSSYRIKIFSFVLWSSINDPSLNRGMDV